MRAFSPNLSSAPKTKVAYSTARPLRYTPVKNYLVQYESGILCVFFSYVLYASLSQPTFGSRIKTPPSDRRPQPLYQKTPPPPKLQHIVEAKSSEEGVQRSAGVGSDSEFDGKLEV